MIDKEVGNFIRHCKLLNSARKTPAEKDVTMKNEITTDGWALGAREVSLKKEFCSSLAGLNPESSPCRWEDERKCELFR